MRNRKNPVELLKQRMYKAAGQGTLSITIKNYIFYIENPQNHNERAVRFRNIKDTHKASVMYYLSEKYLEALEFITENYDEIFSLIYEEVEKRKKIMEEQKIKEKVTLDKLRERVEKDVGKT